MFDATGKAGTHKGRRLDSKNDIGKSAAGSNTAFAIAAGAVGLTITLMESDEAAASVKPSDLQHPDSSSSDAASTADAASQPTNDSAHHSQGIAPAVSSAAAAMEAAALQDNGAAHADFPQPETGTSDETHAAESLPHPQAAAQIPAAESSHANPQHEGGTSDGVVEIASASQDNSVATNGYHSAISLEGHAAIGDGLQPTLNDRADFQIDPGTGALESLMNGRTDELGDILTGATDGLGDALTGVTDGLGDTLSGVTDGLGDTLSGVTDGLGDTLSGVTGGLGDTLSGVTDGLGDTLSGVTDGLGDTLSGVTDGLGDTLSGVTEGLGDTLTGVTGGLGGTLSGVTDGLGDTLSGVTGGLGKVLSGIAGGIGDIFSSVTNGLGSDTTTDIAESSPLDSHGYDSPLTASSDTDAASSSHVQPNIFDVAEHALTAVDSILGMLAPDVPFLGQSSFDVGEHHELANSHGNILHGFS